MYEGRIDPIESNLFKEIRSNLHNALEAMGKIHRLQLDPPLIGERREKRIHILLSEEENEALAQRLQGIKLADYFRNRVFSDTSWEYCRTVPAWIYDQIKAKQWDLSEAVASMTLSEEPGVEDILRSINWLCKQAELKLKS
jgi:hypothetical protein